MAGAVHLDETLRKRGAVVVICGCDQLLARPASPKISTGRCRGHQKRVAAAVLSWNALDDDLVPRLAVSRNGLDLNSNCAVQRVFTTTITLSIVSGFSEKIECAQLGRLHGRLDCADGRNMTTAGRLVNGILNPRQRSNPSIPGSQTSSRYQIVACAG